MHLSGRFLFERATHLNCSMGSYSLQHPTFQRHYLYCKLFMNKTMCFPLSASFQGRDDDDEEEKTAAVSAYLVSV